MNLREKIYAINAEKQEIMQKYRGVKTEFRSYITDKNVPVLERWDFFVHAPSELKNNKDYLWEPQSNFLKKFFDKLSDFPEVYGRGKNIYLGELLNDIVCQGKIYMECVYVENISEDEVKNALEEILSLNLEYFVFDW